MGVISFKIEHNRLLNGPFPKKEIESISGITIDIERVGPLKEFVTFTIDNQREEDGFALAYELGAAVDSYSQVYKQINQLNK